MKTRLIVLSAVAMVALFLAVMSAHADVVTFTEKNCGNCGETNILFGHPEQSGQSIMGTTVHGMDIVEFTTTAGNTLFAKGGQSDIGPCAAIHNCPGEELHN